MVTRSPNKNLLAIAQGNILRPLEELAKATEERSDLEQQTLRVVARRLRGLRQSQKVSLRQLAKAMNLSAPYISDIELGRRNLSHAFAKQYIETVITL